MSYRRHVFEHCLYFNTTALARVLEREWSAAFAELELTPPQGFVLRVVFEHPGISQRELADTMAIARPTATRVLDGLERRKLITRKVDGEDARERQIFPTPSALALRERITAASASVTKRLKADLGTRTFEDAVSALRGIRTTIDSEA